METPPSKSQNIRNGVLSKYTSPILSNKYQSAKKEFKPVTAEGKIMTYNENLTNPLMLKMANTLSTEEPIN